MANDRTTRELLDAEHLAENRREYWIERGAWAGMILILLAAVLGGLGPGPLSQREARTADGTLSVKYAAMERYQSPSQLHIRWIGERPPTDRVEIALSRPLADRTELKHLTPPPARVETREDAVVLVYDAAAVADGRPIVYRYQHEHFGSLAFDVSLVGGRGLRVAQFVWP
jgi:hypothetical protein